MKTVLLVVVVVSTLYIGHYSTALECDIGETKIESWYAYEPAGRNCSALIAELPDNYHPDFIEDCKRWMGPDHPDLVWNYFIFKCEELNDGRLKYMAEVCCNGTASNMCFECNDYTSNSYCREHASAVECGVGTKCQTTVRYEGLYPNTQKIRTTGCGNATVCDALSGANDETCVDWILDPTCSYCCSNSHCNYKPPAGPDLYVGDDPCMSQPCQNGGTCWSAQPPEVYFNCTCPPGYEDPLCSTYVADPCGSDPCLHGGVCVELSDTEYECHCTIAWGGENCEDPYQDCGEGNSYCMNGGTCYNHASYGKRCLCPDYYLGTYCEFDKANCSIEMAYRVAGTNTYVDTDCTTRLLIDQEKTDSESGLYWCTVHMQQPGKPLFQNYIHGEVHEVESRSHHHCSSGDTHTFVTTSWCCPTCHSMPCLNDGWCTQDENDDYVCKCRAGWYGRNCELRRNLCIISGDPHYETFDGVLMHFQGMHSYEMTTSLSTLEDTFTVIATNEGVGAVSYLLSMTIRVCDHTVILNRGHAVTVDGRSVDPAAYVEMDCLVIMMNGGHVRLQTTYNLVVQFDGLHTGFIQVPTDFMGQIEGLCGNFDGDPDTDYVDRDGNNFINDPYREWYVGIGWQVGGSNETEPMPVMNCSAIEDQINSYQYCGHLMNDTGLFAECLTDGGVSSETDVANCQYDVCANSPDEVAMKQAACGALDAFVLKCEAAGHPMTWRDSAGCPLICEDGFVYSPSASACPPTCRMPDAPASCTLPDKEGCVCPNNTLLDSGKCIAPSLCGCIDNFGNKFEEGDWWLSETCDTNYTCEMCTNCEIPMAAIVEKPTSCPTEDICMYSSPGIGTCELYIDPCLQVYCQNLGVCWSEGLNWECQCRIGWTGQYCDVVVPECPAGNGYCLNGGTCMDHGIYGYRCVCPIEWVGTVCEIPQMNCTVPSAYRIGGDTNPMYEKDCTEQIAKLQDSLDNENGMYYCKKWMVDSGDPLFEDGVDGQVDEVEGRSYHVCGKGDVYAFATHAWCCPSCYSIPCLNGGFCTQTETHDYHCACTERYSGRNCEIANDQTTVAP